MNENYKPLVSILIPCFNAQDYIAEALDSCLNQTYNNIEIIVVDDGSTDNSQEIALSYQAKATNLKVFKQNNLGAPAARNRAFQNSNGLYIQYLDADDILDLSKIELQVALLEAQQINSIVFGVCKVFSDHIADACIVGFSPVGDIRNGIHQNVAGEVLLDIWSSSLFVPQHSWLTPRRFITEVDGWDETLLKNQDGVFFAKLLMVTPTVIFDDRAVAYYRIANKQSISRKSSFSSELSRLQSFKIYEELFDGHLTSAKVRRSLAIVYSYFYFSNYPQYQPLTAHALKRIHELGFNSPINVNIRMYSILEPLIGIRAAIRLHKLLSAIKQQIRRCL